jgi:hypothetical protein
VYGPCEPQLPPQLPLQPPVSPAVAGPIVGGAISVASDSNPPRGLIVKAGCVTPSRVAVSGVFDLQALVEPHISTSAAEYRFGLSLGNGEIFSWKYTHAGQVAVFSPSSISLCQGGDVVEVNDILSAANGHRELRSVQCPMRCLILGVLSASASCERIPTPEIALVLQVDPIALVLVVRGNDFAVDPWALRFWEHWTEMTATSGSDLNVEQTDLTLEDGRGYVFKFPRYSFGIGSRTFIFGACLFQPWFTLVHALCFLSVLMLCV